MPAPVVSPITQELYDKIVPLQYAESDLGWPLLKFLDAFSGTLQDIEDLIRDSYNSDGTLRPGWADVMDVDAAPTIWLPWLAQFVGINVGTGATDAQIRNLIKGVGGMHRGTPAAMIAAGKLHLTGTKTVVLRERSGAALGANQVTNPGMAVDLSGYDNYFLNPPTSKTRVADANPPSGFAMEVVCPAVVNSGVTYHNSLQLKQGQVVTVAISVDLISGGPITSPSLVQVAAPNAGVGIAPANIAAFGWNTYSITWKVPTTGEYVILFQTPGAAATFRVSNVSVKITDNAYTFTVITYAAETPFPAQTLADLTDAKPAGLVMVYETLPGWDYIGLETVYPTPAKTYADLRTDWAGQPYSSFNVNQAGA